MCRSRVEEGPFRMLGTLLEANPYLGRIITGRITSGSVKPNQMIKVLSQDGTLVETGRISKILAFRGLERQPIEEGHSGRHRRHRRPGEGHGRRHVLRSAVTEPIKAQPIDPPTVSMTFMVNDSPLAGTEGDKVTSRVIRDRLLKEAEGNVALKIEESDDKDASSSRAAASLQLAILIEKMRREGFELGVSRPRVVLKRDEAFRASCSSRSRKSSSTSTRSIPASSCRRCPSARPT
jgi:GTP-binding protein